MFKKSPLSYQPRKLIQGDLILSLSLYLFIQYEIQ